MKKIISFVLAALMLVSAIPTALATNDYTAGTQVTYDATADNDGDGQPDSAEAYTVTVPAKLAPGGSGDVTLSGTWAVDRYITVTADKEIDMVNSINSNDKKVLAVTFDGIGKRGSNTEAQTVTKSISVENITDALFGTWSGHIEYNVTIETRIVDLAGTTWQFNEHISGYEWIPNGGTDGTTHNTIMLYSEGKEVNNNASFQNVQGLFSVYGTISSSDVIFAFVSEDAGAQLGVPNLSGWVSCNYTLADDVLFRGDMSQWNEMIVTVESIAAPKATFLDVENNYFNNLQLIDWMYDNAVMQ